MSSTNRKILVVDDDEGVLSAYEEILAASAYEDETAALMGLLSGNQETMESDKTTQAFNMAKASSAEEAIDCFHQAFHAGTPFSTVFLDVRMPPGMTGIECGVRLRAIDPSVYLVIATAYADYSTEEIRDELGRDFLYLKKPFVPEELAQVAELLSLFREREQQREEEIQRLREQVL